VFLAILTLPISVSVLAQTEDEINAEGYDNVLEEVIVNATRREESIMQIDRSIQAIPEAMLELPSFNEVSDVTMMVPGATAFSNKQPTKEGIQFRGSGIVQSGADDGQAPVGYYVDDVPYVDISTPVPPPIGTFDLERIEIIRGPQGTSYGQDSTAGSVIMRTNPVDLNEFGYKIRAGISNTKSVDDMGWNIGGVVNIPIAEDVFGIRISYLREDDPGYGRVETRPDIDDPLAYTRDSARIKLFWNVAEWMDLELTHSEWNTDYNFLPGSSILTTINGEMVLNPADTEMLLALFPSGLVKNKYEISWTTLMARFDLGFAELTSSTGYVDTPLKETNAEFIFDIGLGPQQSAYIFNQPAESLTQQFRLVSTNDSKLQWIAGLFYLDAESSSGGFTDTPDFLFREEVHDPIEAETWAIFGEIQYSFNEQWSVEAGLRYQEEERTYYSFYSFADYTTYFTDPLFGPYSTQFPPEKQETDFDSTSYRVSLNWRPTDEGLVYLSNSTSYRAPILLLASDLRDIINAGLEIPQGSFDSAKLLNTELGTKWTLLEGKMQLEAAYVFSDWTNIPMWAQLNVPPYGLSLPVGGTDGDIKTFEVGIAWAVHDYFTLNYGGAFTDTKVTNIPDGDDVTGYPPAVVLGGDLFNYAPQTHNFGVNYFQPLNGSDWSLIGGLNYVIRDRPDGINVFDLFATEYIPARDKFKNLSFNFGAQKGRWTVTFAVANATNERGMFQPATANRHDGFILAPRTYSLQLTYDHMR